MAQFRVDTHLFRELGELLVGRDSTALIELVKNAYDADATLVTVLGSNLSTPGTGSIEISDNGTGMTLADFERGFLTVAGRTKDTPTRRSARYQRKYTGAKGIGRLAAHKLCRSVEIDSVAQTTGPLGDSRLAARIDWDELERHELLEQAADAVSVSSYALKTPREPGTTIRLAPVRRRWTERQLVTFLAEVQAFEPPALLVRPLDDKLLSEKTLFARPNVRDVARTDPGFEVRLEGDFDLGDALWEAVEHSVSWVLDVDARADSVTYRIVPSRRTTEREPEARAHLIAALHPRPQEGPFFQARVLIREGDQPGSQAVKAWAATASGIRVFMEGFRVLPYGDRSDDWLDIAAESTRRSDRLSALDRSGGVEFVQGSLPPEQDREGLSALAPTHYFGAVLLTEENAPSMRMLVNREGFVPDDSFECLRALMKTGIHLSIRARAAASHERRRRRSAERRSTDEVPDERELVPIVGSVESLAREAREHLAANRIAEAAEASDRLGLKLRQLRAGVAALGDQQALFRVVASVGMQMGAFIHELNALVGGAKATEGALRDLRAAGTLPASARREIGQLERAVNGLRQGLERQASFLTDVVSADARRRRSRQSAAERFNAAARLVAAAADRRGVTLTNRISDDLQTRPMFPAELTAVFTNLLTNAIKAAGEGGRVTATGRYDSDGDLVVRISNTGVKVDLEEAERWFRPFESTTVDVDAVLGQGMGLGLPVTRMMLEQYGGRVAFVTPARNYATTIETVIPQK